MFSFKMWQRGVIHNLKFRLHQSFSNRTNFEKINLALLSIIFAVSGAFIYYNVNILGNYETRADRLDFRFGYEKKYKKYESLETLAFVKISTKMDLYPAKGRYDFKVKCVLENLNEDPIQQVLVTARLPLDSIYLENATLVEYDAIFDTYLYEFKDAIAPQEQLTFNFSLTKENSGFNNDKDLIKNGSHIFQHNLQPTLGYRRSLEITDEFERKKRGLKKRAVEKITDDHIQAHHHQNIVSIDFETIISTNKKQNALAPGNLVNQWTENDRNYFHYQSPQQILNSIAYFSAEYAIKKVSHKGVSIEQYYHPAHEFNIEVAEESTKLTLDYCIENFGSYPFDHIRIAEIPGHFPFGGQAMPGIISMVEDRFYLIDNTDSTSFDLVAKRTIHEVAHQWWGMILTPKIVEGGSILTEGLAKYTEAVVMEKKYGKSAIWQISESANERYFSGRSFASRVEPPLYYADGEGYLSYGKNFTVMLALKELLGEEKVNQVLKLLVDRHKNDLKPSATSVEFLDELYTIAPLEYHALIDDWMKKVITYDLKITNAKAHKRNDGKYLLSLAVSANRFETQKNGASIPISIDEPIQIGAFTKHPNQIRTESPVLFQSPIQINQEKMEIKIVTDELPKYVAIDPFGTRSDKNRLDNFQLIEDIVQ